jgi:putative ABC transport system permease protein
MIAHYLAVALARIRKAPFTSAANALTLALGLACFVAAYGIAAYWQSADDHHARADEIYVVSKSLVYEGDDRSAFPGGWSAGVLARYLREDFPDIEVARATSGFEVPVAADDRRMQMRLANADPEFLELFDLEFVAGDRTSALSQPDSVVLTEDAALRLFGREDALGRTVRVSGRRDLTVTGVIAPVRQPSFMGAHADAVMAFDMLADWYASFNAVYGETDDAWISFLNRTFVALPSTQARAAFEAELPAFVDRRVPAQMRESAAISFEVFPVGELATRGLNDLLFARSGVRLSAAAVLLGLGLLTLGVACVNYANLATAQGATRAKEFGMRRVLGAGRGQVMAQAWIEAGLLTLLALAAALGVLALAAPWIRAASSVDVLYFLGAGPGSLGVVLAIVAGVALVAGGYPALVLARVRPAEALHAGRSRAAPRFVARLLVGVQFFSASFLLILVTVAHLQRGELERAALAPRPDPIVALRGLFGLDVSFDTLAARLAAIPGVESVTRTDFAPWTPAANILEFTRTPEAGARALSAYAHHVDYGYFETLSIGVRAGRTFDRERDTIPAVLWQTDPAETPSVLVDEAYAHALGFESPDAAIGEIVYIPSQSISRRGAPAQPLRIIGVVETDVMRVAAGEPEGHIYSFAPEGFNQVPLLRISPNDVAGTLAAIDRAWTALAPDVPASPQFFDELFEQSFRTYARVSGIFILLASTAFFIASLGQLGIAMHVASRRRHEIGVRKTLGSTTLGVIQLLLVDFSKPVLIANLAAWPVGYLAARTYLSAFAHPVALTPAPFALSLVLTLAIAWAAVIGEVLKAASVRPAEVLRHA